MVEYILSQTGPGVDCNPVCERHSCQLASAARTMVITLALTVYLTVLLAELAGDKTLYTVGTLATSYRILPVIAGSGIAVALKMLVAVLLGRLVAGLPPLVLSLISAVTFVGLAIGAWVSKPHETRVSIEARANWAAGIGVSFLGIFLTEWADFGQVAAASLVAEHGHPWVVWAFASLAMLTKVVVAVAFGMTFRRWVPASILRPLTIAVCLIMAVLTAFRVEL